MDIKQETDIPGVHSDPAAQLAFEASIQAHLRGERCTDSNCMSCSSEGGKSTQHYTWKGGCHHLKPAPFCKGGCHRSSDQ